MHSSFLRGLAVGLLLGFLISTSTLWILQDTRETVVVFLGEHIANFVTLFAAGLALWGVSRQIQSNADATDQQRIAKLDASRSLLPIVLSNIHRVCEERYSAISMGRGEPVNDELWEISAADFETLKECIELAAGIEKSLMQQIPRVYQVLISRWKLDSMVNLFEGPSDSEFQKFERRQKFYDMQNWIALRAVADALFDYSRGEISNPTKPKMKKSVYFTMQHIGSGRGDDDAGWLLTNCDDYRDFVQSQIQSDSVPFIDDIGSGGWKSPD